MAAARNRSPNPADRRRGEQAVAGADECGSRRAGPGGRLRYGNAVPGALSPTRRCLITAVLIFQQVLGLVLVPRRAYSVTSGWVDRARTWAPRIAGSCCLRVRLHFLTEVRIGQTHTRSRARSRLARQTALRSRRGTTRLPACAAHTHRGVAVLRFGRGGRDIEFGRHDCDLTSATPPTSWLISWRAPRRGARQEQADLPTPPPDSCLACGGSTRRRLLLGPPAEGHFQKSMPPMPPRPAHRRGGFLGLVGDDGSVVRNRAAIEAAFCSAERVTLAGSMMPALIRSMYSPVAALSPQ